MRDNRDKGAIVVEASIALPVYVFVIFTILSIDEYMLCTS